MPQRLRIALAVAVLTLATACASSTSPSSLTAATHMLRIIPSPECHSWPATPPELWAVRVKAVQVRDTIEATTADPPLYWPTMYVRLYESSTQIGEFTGEIGGGNRIHDDGWLLTVGLWPDLNGGPYGASDGRAPVRAQGSLATTIQGAWNGYVSVNVPDSTWTNCGWPTHQLVLERLYSILLGDRRSAA